MRRCVAFSLACAVATPAGAAPVPEDVRRVGLPFLYQALFAVANCPELRVDARRFARAAALYRLRPEDLTLAGRFGDELAPLDASLRLRFRDDRQASCSAARLTFAVDHGILEPATPLDEGEGRIR